MILVAIVFFLFSNCNALPCKFTSRKTNFENTTLGRFKLGFATEVIMAAAHFELLMLLVNRDGDRLFVANT